MNRKTRFITQAAILAALYAVLTHMQNLLLPGTATWAIQCRLSEAMCVLAFFTSSAVPGLTIGCMLFNLTFAGSLPLDFLVGSLATFCATGLMWLSRRITFRGIPILGLIMPALTNAVLVGWELTLFIGGGFFLNALYVALGELIVLMSFGLALYQVIRKRHLQELLFKV